MNIDIGFFIDFSKLLRTNIISEEETIEGRHRKITFTDIIYCITHLSLNNSYYITNMNMFINNILDVSVSALIKKRDTISSKHFKLINECLLNKIYKYGNVRILGVDGTYIPLSIELKNEGFSTNPNNTYCIALLSSIYDINREIIVDYYLCKTRNEREGLLNQLKYLNENDILLLDRGYYSLDLMYSLHNINVKFIFRLTKNLNYVKVLKNKNQESTITTFYRNKIKIKMRIIKYEIDEKKYYLGTNILNHSNEYFKHLYYKRWCIETHFRTSKYVLSLINIKSLSYGKVLQDIYIHQLIFIIVGFLKENLQRYIKTDCKINTKLLINTTINYLIYYMLYVNFGVSIKDKIVQIFNKIIDSHTKIRKNRSYDRKRIKPVSKFHYCV